MCGFFLQNFRRFYKKYPSLFGEQSDEVGENEEGGQDFSDGFNENFGWLYNTERVAKLKGITYDEADRLSLIEFFNWLVYIKFKERHEIAIAKNAIKPK